MRRLLLVAVMFDGGQRTGGRYARFSSWHVARIERADPNWDGWYAGGQVGDIIGECRLWQSLVGLTNDIYRDTVLAGPDVAIVSAG